jgi:hypothetical protein
LLGLAGECIGANTAARQRGLPLELLPLEALLLVRRMSGDPPRPTHPHPRSPRRPLMAGRAMATAQGLTLTPWSSILLREDGAEPNRMVINFVGRHRIRRAQQKSPDLSRGFGCQFETDVA